MLKPKYLEQLPAAMVELYSQVEQDILADMARRISTYDYWIPAAEHQHKVMAEMGNFHSYVMEALSARTGKSRRQLEALMAQAGQKALDFDMGVYEAHGLAPPTLAASKPLQAVLRSGMKQTNGLFTNLTRTTAKTATGQFEAALDRAWLQISSGAFDREAAIRTAVKDLAREGVQSIRYPSGHTDTLEVAVRRATVTGVNQTALKLQEELADEMGSDLVEVTAHEGARPDHALWQGQIYSRSGKSKKYKGLREATGLGDGHGLGGWNCRHSYSPYFEGSPRAYTPQMLKDFEKKDYTYNGQAMTEYEATQQQRYLERQIRRWKRENVAMSAAGLDTTESAAKIHKWQTAQKDFQEQTGRKRQSGREQIAGWGRQEATGIQVLAQRRKAEYNKAKEGARTLIRSDETPKAINLGAQNKHIKASKGYIDGRSYIYGDADAAQALVDRYSGTGEPRLTRAGAWTHKEFITADEPVGVLLDQKTGAGVETKRFSIHYSKKGAHVVPAKEDRTP